MDIVTHGAIGIVLAAPFAESDPVLASSIVAGSVLPDIDALSRAAGKRAFLATHQTASHSLAVALVSGVGWAAVLAASGLPAVAAGVGLALAMAVHGLLDFTNTYGVTLLWPFDRRRRSLEWVFFIDATVIGMTFAALVWVLLPLSRGEPAGWWGTAAWLGGVSLYWLLKAALRRRAERLGPPGAASYIPSALWPWRFYGCAPEEDSVELFTLDAVTGSRSRVARVPIHDTDFRATLSNVPEFRQMAELSAAYHVVDVERRADAVALTCRDLRTRNFGGRFGELRAVLDTAGKALEVELHV